jgi:hypothetical protein
MIKKILLGFATLVAAILILAAFQADTYRVERSITIAASPAELFPHVNDLRKTQAWSPWTKLDPSAKITYEGPAAGVGASNSWVGNSDMGEGRQTIIESRAHELVRTKLEFFKPMADVATGEFLLKPAGTGTTVTWSMAGSNNYASKIFCMFMSMEKMIGGPFEEGLANLKKLAETPAKK